MTDTKAETRVPDVIPGVSAGGESAFTVVGMLVALVAGIFHFRRKASRDNTEIIKDRTEGQLIQDMMKDREHVLRERDEARKSERMAWAEANQCAVANAKLRSDNEYHQRELARLTQTIDDLQRSLNEVKERLENLSKGSEEENR